MTLAEELAPGAVLVAYRFLRQDDGAAAQLGLARRKRRMADGLPPGYGITLRERDR